MKTSVTGEIDLEQVMKELVDSDIILKNKHKPDDSDPEIDLIASLGALGGSDNGDMGVDNEFIETEEESTTTSTTPSTTTTSTTTSTTTTTTPAPTTTTEAKTT